MLVAPGGYSSEENSAWIENGRQILRVFDPKFPVVSGRVIAEGVSPGASLPRIPVMNGTSRVLSSANGTFVPTVEFFPSTDVRVSVPMEAGGFGDYYVKSIVYGLIDLLRDPLKLDTTTSENITITLAIGSHVAGNVRSENGEPANISVYLIPRTPVVERPDLPGWTNTDALGNFVLRGVAPGEYDIFSESMLDSGRNAVPVTVGANPIPPLSLTLGPRRSLLTR